MQCQYLSATKKWNADNYYFLNHGGFNDHQHKGVVVGEEEIFFFSRTLHSKRTNKKKIKQRLCTGYYFLEKKNVHKKFIEQ